MLSAIAAAGQLGDMYVKYTCRERDGKLLC
jgi:hypothetical protein